MRVKKKVIIVGGGFGGVYTSKYLKKLLKEDLVEVTLLNKTNYFLFTPLLHEVATGGLSPLSAAESIREILKKIKIDFCQTEVRSIDFDQKIVKTNDGHFNYDFLVLAPGANTEFYNIPGAEEYGMPLKTLYDAVKIRTKIIDSFEKASVTNSPELRQELLTFTIVGGGATGVELAAEISEFSLDTLYSYYSKTLCKKNDIKIILISNNKDLLPRFPKELREWSLKSLKLKGIDIKLESQVSSVSQNEITINNGQKIKTQNVFWSAGVTPNFPELIGNTEVGKNGIKVNEYLQAEKQNSVFVLGDGADFSGRDKSPLPMLAQVAVNQAKNVTKNIENIIKGRDLRPFEYKSKGHLISLGQWNAVGNIYGFKLRGRFTWWLWRTVYLFKFISFKKKLRIAFEWTVNLFYPRDITKIN